MALPAEVQEALRRGAVVWVGLDGRPPRAVWHVWRDGAVHVVAGGGEQDLPGAADATSGVVVVRDRAGLGARRAELAVDVERLAAGTPAWDAVVPVLAAERLNGPPPPELPERWAREAVVLRLTPSGGT